MFRFLLLISLFFTGLFAQNIKLNYVSDVNKIKIKLLDSKLTKRIKMDIKDRDKTMKILNKYSDKYSQNKEEVSKEKVMMQFAMLKSLVEYKLNQNIVPKDLVKDINTNVLKEFRNFKIPLTFAYKIVFKDEERVQNQLLKYISQYISKNYAVSYITSQRINKNGHYSEYIDESKYGIIKQSSQNISFNREYLENGDIVLTGVNTYNFYPFYKAKKSSFHTNSNLKRSSNKIKFINLDKVNVDFATIFNDTEKEKISSYYSDNKSRFISINQQFITKKVEIEQKQKFYHNIRMSLFSIDKKYQSFKMLKKGIDKFYTKKEEHSLGTKKVFVYELNKALDFNSAYTIAVCKFVSDLEKSTAIVTIDEEENISGNSINESNNNQNIKPLYKRLRVAYFIDNKQPKLLFLADISFEEQNYCRSMITNVSNDEVLKSKFLEYNYNGQKIAIMEHEVTKKQFQNFVRTQKDINIKKLFPHKKCQGYYKTLDNDKPVSCVTSSAIKKYIKWLNTKDNGYYRLPKCNEWQHIASCNNKNKFCWGNELNKKNRNENIKSPSRKVCRVKSYNLNGALLYDMCGNVSEYCIQNITKKRKRIKVVGGNFRKQAQEIQQINKYKTGRTYGFRLIKEM